MRPLANVCIHVPGGHVETLHGCTEAYVVVDTRGWRCTEWAKQLGVHGIPLEPKPLYKPGCGSIRQGIAGTSQPNCSTGASEREGKAVCLDAVTTAQDVSYFLRSSSRIVETACAGSSRGVVACTNGGNGFKDSTTSTVTKIRVLGETR